MVKKEESSESKVSSYRLSSYGEAVSWDFPSEEQFRIYFAFEL